MSSETALSQWLRAEMPRRGYPLGGPRAGGITRLAEDAGIPQASMSRLVNSGGEPSIDNLRKIGQVLGYTLAEMMVFAGIADPDEMTIHDGSAVLSSATSLTASGDASGDANLTEDGFPIPPRPEKITLPRLFDPTSLPLHEVGIWYVQRTTIKERAELVGYLRRRRQEEQDAAAALRASNGGSD